MFSNDLIWFFFFPLWKDHSTPKGITTHRLRIAILATSYKLSLQKKHLEECSGPRRGFLIEIDVCFLIDNKILSFVRKYIVYP